MSNLNRRTFIKVTGSGLALSSLNPFEALAEKNPLKKSDLNLETLKFDVAVVGAGAAGVPAAISAAREGAKVVLIEEDFQPGGAPVDMFVTFMCGEPRVSIYNEMIQELNSRHSLNGKPVSDFGKYGKNGNKHWWMPSSFQIVIGNLIAREKNITLMCGASVFDTIVQHKGNRNIVKGVRIIRNGKFQNIEAKVTIDATGTGLVAAQAGCDFMYGREAKSDYNESVGLEKGDRKPQPCTLMYITQRLRKDAEIPFDKMQKTDFLENNFRWISIKDDKEATAKRDAGTFLRWGATVPCSDTLDTVAVSQSHKQALSMVEPEIFALQEAGFSVFLAPKIGIRECRRIKGEYIMKYDDIANGIMPFDKIAEARYPIDVWGMENLPIHLKPVPPYGIPYRSLLPIDMEGLLLAGRIISGTHLAASSYRVQSICSAIGEAAGVAAAMTAMQNTQVRDIDILRLQNRLDEKGMFDAFR